MTNAELLALLRQAREEFAVLASYVEDPAFNWPSLGLKVTAKRHRKMRDCIDAALAPPKTDFLMGVRPGICSYCGHPENSTTCQRGHP